MSTPQATNRQYTSIQQSKRSLSDKSHTDATSSHDIESQIHPILYQRQFSTSKYTIHNKSIIQQITLYYNDLQLPCIKSLRLQSICKLMVLCILCIFIALFMFNIIHIIWQLDILHTQYNSYNNINHTFHLTASNTSLNEYYDVPLVNDAIWRNITHLIIVAGHTVLRTTHTHDMYNQSNWYLEPYQKHQLSTYLQHIRYGIELVTYNTNSILLFSGGETRIGGILTESHSYYIAADVMNINNTYYNKQLKHRILTEEYARDSYENLLYGIARYYEITTQYPHHITVIGFQFKRDRFVSLHRTALRIPESMFTYIGIDPVNLTRTEYNTILNGELHNSYNLFINDPYGCNQLLHRKKYQRNPYRRQAPYLLTNPALRDLLLHCGPELYQHELPWT